MTKYSVRLLGPLMIATLALVGVGAASAVAATPAVTFVGTYTVQLTVGTVHEKGTIQINANGTATNVQTGAIAHWKSAGKTITIMYKNPQVSETFVGTRTKKGIGSKAHPGSYTNSLGGTGTWYAIKTA